VRKDLRSCRLDVRAGTLSSNGGCVRGAPVAADGRACSLSTTKRSWAMHPSAACNCSHSQTEPGNQGIMRAPISLFPNVATSQLAMSAACLASAKSPLCVPTSVAFWSVSRQSARDWPQHQGVDCLARAAERQRIQFDPRRQTFHLETWGSTKLVEFCPPSSSSSNLSRLTPCIP